MSRERARPSAAAPRARVDAVRAVVDETVALFHRLRAAAATLHGEGETSAGRRGVLRGLARTGLQTVPQIARSRPVSRQHIQALVDALRADGLVELLENPAHVRSRLVALTRAGEALCREMERGESEVYAAISDGLSTGDLEISARTLRSLRAAFENERGRKR